MTRRGMQMIFVGAFAPGTVGGRRAFPPTAEHNFAQSINDKERKKAIRSALAAVVDKTVVQSRGHKVPANYPFILATDSEGMKKTKDILALLEKLGFEAELERGGK